MSEENDNIYTINCALYLRAACVEQNRQPYNLGMVAAIVEDSYAANFEGEYRANLYLYDDSGFSGLDEDRPALKRLLVDIQEHHIEAVAFPAVPALSRSIEQLTNLVGFFARHRTQLILVPPEDAV